MRLSKLKKLVTKSSTKLVFYSVITVTITAVILNLSQILRPLELAIYDLNFSLRLIEPTDERIVVVEWDETSLQSLNETIISDQTLADLLQTIKKQKPRIIGLDLYRDIPVSSPRLSDEQNNQAHNYLKEVFRTTDNLIGVKKVINPIVNPPPILTQKDQIAASDLLQDRDQVIRRSYIYPQLDLQGISTGSPYFGVKLGYEYLVRENFWAKRFEHNSMKIFKDKTEIILRPLKSFVGAFALDEYSFNILINWRKGKPAFKSISVVEILNDRVEKNFLADKIVLIGNVSISSADLHNTPIDQPQLETFGVYLVAQIVSSIINAALEGRSLLNPVPELVVLIFIIVSSVAIFYLIIKNQDLNTFKLYFKSATIACILSIFLIIFSVLIFSLGYWMPITTAISCIWSLYFTLNYFIYRQKEQKTIFVLKSFVADFNHNLGNRLSSINFCNDKIHLMALELNNTEDSEKRKLITKKTSDIKNQILKIERYRDSIQNFIDFSYLNYSNNLLLTNINLFVSNIVAKFLAENGYEYEVCVQEVYDEQLGNAKIDRAAIEIVIENLLDNAFYSVSPRLRANQRSEYCPSVKIKTELANKKINFIVEDNGAGIKKENINKIFEPFVSFELGQGMGLFLISQIAKIYQGSIKVESEIAKGSKFIFTIPY